MYHRSEVRWQSGPLSGLSNDQGIHCTTFPEIVGALQLRRFPRWPPNNLSSWGAHRELQHCCLLILCQPDKSEWEECQSMGSFHMLFDRALSGKFVRTTGLSVTRAIGHGNFVRVSGVMICYCFITPSRRGRLWKRASGSLLQQNTLPFRSRHGDYGYIAATWS